VQIIHLFWQQISNDFNNKGCLYSWLDQAKSAKTKSALRGGDSKNNVFYPFQAPEASLVAWFGEYFDRFLPVKKRMGNYKGNHRKKTGQSALPIPALVAPSLLFRL
jgi:hypothetical protein